MAIKYRNTVNYLFYILFFAVPLILFTKTSEIFEFNKIVLVYLITILITGVWLAIAIIEKKIPFKRTALDIPIIIFLLSQIISTFLSIDTRTSIFGYYSRFHGGLLSSISYVLLYWAYVTFMDKVSTLKALLFFISSAVIVSIYAVLQHFGIDKDIWVQDVQMRVFSTLGQPNWLAAFITAILPISTTFYLTPELFSKLTNKNSFSKLVVRIITNKWFWLSITTLFFLALLYTKSRSGILGFFVASTTYWILAVYFSLRQKDNLGKLIKGALIVNAIFIVLAVVSGTPWTPGITKMFNKSAEVVVDKPTGPALEVGGTDSGEIRKIVWTGAIDVWKNYPIFGSGLETFGFSYYAFRPQEHNLVSEWDFLYNKAHNEYLNFAANSGTVGLIAYLTLIVAILYILVGGKALTKISKNTKQNNSDTGHWSLMNAALFSGVTGILVSNVFGFSVVPVALQLFLYPAIALSINTIKDKRKDSSNVTTTQKLGIYTVLALMLYTLYLLSRYWYVDYVYANGKLANDRGNPIKAHQDLTTAVKLSPNEAIYWNELANSFTDISRSFWENENSESASIFAKQAIETSKRAVSLSPASVNLKRNRASIYIKLSAIDENYLPSAVNEINNAIAIAPTDAKLYYNLGLAYVKLGDNDKALKIFDETIEMKSNYANARFAKGLVSIDVGDPDTAKYEFEYILKEISPDHKAVKRELDELLDTYY